MTFARFIAGESNRLAYMAAQRIVGGAGLGNPLFLYGPRGSGKTHLLQAIAHDRMIIHEHDSNRHRPSPGIQLVSGTIATIRVPSPGLLFTVSRPFTRATRSRMLNSPIPGRRSSARRAEVSVSARSLDKRVNP